MTAEKLFSNHDSGRNQSALKLARHKPAESSEIVEHFSSVNELLSPILELMTTDELVQAKELLVKELKKKRQEAEEPYDDHANGVNP